MWTQLHGTRKDSENMCAVLIEAAFEVDNHRDILTAKSFTNRPPLQLTKQTTANHERCFIDIYTDSGW